MCSATASNLEGPFFKAGAPVRSILVTESDPGERLVLSGYVRDRACAPVVGARIEIWHADARGAYDNEGHHFRGVLETDASGAFRVQTVLPGRYLNGPKYRPAHIHAKVHVTGRAVLTTQLYFEGDPENLGDPFIVDSLIMAHTVDQGMRKARFDFVV
jgi:protocatechuate 3,4-dioxygenase beta subunit